MAYRIIHESGIEKTDEEISEEDKVTERWQAALGTTTSIRMKDEYTLAIIDDSDGVVIVQYGLRNTNDPNSGRWVIKAFCVPQDDTWEVSQLIVQELIDRGHGRTDLLWMRPTVKNPTFSCSDAATTVFLDTIADSFLSPDTVQFGDSRFFRITPNKAKRMMQRAGVWV